MKIITKTLLVLLSLAVIPALLGCSGGSSGGGGGGKHKNPLPKWNFPGSLSNSISPAGFNSGEEPYVATDSSGNTIIVWEQSDGSNNQIFKAEYRDGTWTYPADETDNISPDGTNAYNPQVAMDDNGNAIIVWQQYDETTDCGGSACRQIFKSEYRGGAWSYPFGTSYSISPDGSHAFEPFVAMDDNGNAIITWYQNDQTTDCGGSGCNQIFKAEYRGSAWSFPFGPSYHISPAGEHSESPRVAMNDNGKAILTWSQWDGSTDCSSNTECRLVYMTMYNGSSWSTVSNLSTDHISPGGDGSSIGVHYSGAWPDMDNNDHAVIAWAQSMFLGGIQIYRSVYNGTDWTHPGTLANAISPGTRANYRARAAMSDNGTAMITWYGEDDTLDCSGARCNQIFVSFYNGTGWEDPADQNDNISPDGTYAGGQDVEMDDNGNAIITWSQKDNTTDCSGSECYQIFKAEYSGGIWNIPADLSNNISPDGSDVGYPDVSMYGNGKAVIGWSQDDGTGDYQVFKAEKR